MADAVAEVLDIGYEPVSTPEITWFEDQSEQASGVAARLHDVAGRLSGELIAGQAASRDIAIGHSLKYEVEDGFVTDLTSLRSNLGADDLDGSRRLMDLNERIERAVTVATRDLRTIVGVWYSASDSVRTARAVFDHAAEGIDDLLSDCTAAIYVAGRR